MKEKLFIAVILLLCLIPSAGMLLPASGETGGNEILAPPPLLRDAEGGINGAYLSQLSGYVEDNYFLRQQLVSAWSALNQNLLHTSIADNVVLGKDGWLYFGGTLDDYTGADLMTDREIFCAARNLTLMDRYVHDQGGSLVFTIAPNKNSLYPEHMPGLTVIPHRSNAEALAERLAIGVGTDYYEAAPDPAAVYVDYADLFSLFRGQEETLYFTQDSHWNAKGAALAADAIMQHIIPPYSAYRQPSYFQETFIPQDNHLSDLYAMLYPTGKWRETNQTYGGELHFTYDKPFRSANDMTIQTSGGAYGESLVMFRDSFGELLYPYFADTFSHAVFSRSMPYKLAELAPEPAVVVIELVERNLDYLIQHPPVMPAPERTVPEAKIVDAPLVLTADPASSPEGYVLVQGTLPVEPAEESAVYLCSGGRRWEAFLLEDNGFALYVPEAGLEDLRVVFTAPEETVSLPAFVQK